jgi:hypothetical protein
MSGQSRSSIKQNVMYAAEAEGHGLSVMIQRDRGAESREAFPARKNVNTWLNGRGDKMKENKKWEAECDFRTLSEAEAIKSDKQRHSTAIKVGSELVKKKYEEANAMKKVAMKKPAMKKTSPKRSMKRKK